MTAEEHNKTLATLHFVYGGIHGLTLLGLLLLVVVIFSSAPAASNISALWIGVAVTVFLVALVAVGLLPLIVGYGFAKQKRWTKSLAMMLAIISLINIPIGTALGLYAIRFLRSDGGVALYGGKGSALAARTLDDARRGAEPLIKWANRIK